jgi:hypothetical protein
MWLNCKKQLDFTSQTKVALEFCRKIVAGPSIPRYAPLSFSAVDPDPLGSLDPFSDPDSRSGSRRAKMTHKHRKKLINLIFDMLEGLFWGPKAYSSLDISKLQFWSQKRLFFFLIF